MSKKIAIGIMIGLLFPAIASASWMSDIFGGSVFGDATITRLDQWAATTTPSDSITQRVYGKTLQLTGLADGCLGLSSGLVVSSGAACGSGSGGSDFPFTPVSYGNATSTTLGLLNGFLVNASSTFPSISYLHIGGGNNTQILSTDGNGNLSWVDDQTGAGGAVTGSGLAGMMTSWASGSAITSTSTILGAQFIATSSKASQLPYASSTALNVSGATYLTGLSQGTANIGAGGLVYSGATTTFGAGLTYSNGAVTCNTASLSVLGCLATVDFARFNSATTTAGTGLTYSGNAFNVNTSQNIATLSNLTSNGFVKTSGGDGTLSVDTNTYLTTAVTSVATNQGLTGGTITTTGTIGLDLTGYPVNNLILTYNGTKIVATGTPALTAGRYIATSTVASQLPYASSTAITATLPVYQPSSFTINTNFATSTATTTAPLNYGTLGVTTQVDSYRCITNMGTIDISINDGMSELFMRASTTANTNVIPGTLVFPSGVLRNRSIGNASATGVFGSCTIQTHSI